MVPPIHDTVRRIAEGLKLLDSGGKLLPVDSLRMIDLAFALERQFEVEISSAFLRSENFESLDSVVELLRQFLDDRSNVAAPIDPPPRS